MTLGTLIYILYTACGFALLPVALIKSAPSISAPTLSANTTSALEQNRERQRQLEGLRGGRELSTKDRRELERLKIEERTLKRRERLAAEASGEDQGWIVKAWIKIEAVFRPLKLIGGLFLMLVAILIWVSMLLTGIDKAKNSICKSHCGYILGHVNVFNPINWIFVMSSKVFPIDYVIFLLLVFFFFASSVVGIAAVGIRFLWLRLFQIRKGHTSPQALLITTVLLTLIVLAINYTVAMFVAPQYSHYGPQTFCDRPLRFPTDQPDCSNDKSKIRPCSEVSNSQAAANVCTPSVVSTFIDSVTVNFSVFGAVCFWSQFAFLGMYHCRCFISNQIIQVSYPPRLFSTARLWKALHWHMITNIHILNSCVPRRFSDHSLPCSQTWRKYSRPGRRRGGRRGSTGEHGKALWRNMAGHYWQGQATNSYRLWIQATGRSRDRGWWLDERGWNE